MARGVFDLRKKSNEKELIEYRIKDIKILLTEGKTLKEVADIMGYAGADTLSRFMKKAGIKCPNKSGRSKRKTMSYEDAVELLKKKRPVAQLERAVSF